MNYANHGGDSEAEFDVKRGYHLKKDQSPADIICTHNLTIRLCHYIFMNVFCCDSDIINGINMPLGIGIRGDSEIEMNKGGGDLNQIHEYKNMSQMLIY